MKLYDCRTAPSPRRVRIFIAEKGLDIPRVEVDLRGGEHLSAAFRALNPECTVPVLELDDGTCIAEAAAICRYLEEIAPEPPLLGTDPVDRALVDMWNRRMEWNGSMAVAEVLRNSAPGMKDRAITGPENVAQIPELAERGRARVRRFMADLDGALAERPFVSGDRFTIADITALCTVDFANRVKIGPEAGQRHLARWHEQVSARPSAAA